jgi:hypothetical protein
VQLRCSCAACDAVNKRPAGAVTTGSPPSAPAGVLLAVCTVTACAPAVSSLLCCGSARHKLQRGGAGVGLAAAARRTILTPAAKPARPDYPARRFAIDMHVQRVAAPVEQATRAPAHFGVYGAGRLYLLCVLLEFLYMVRCPPAPTEPDIFAWCPSEAEGWDSVIGS